MGMVISPRRIVTCAHVANVAAGYPPDSVSRPSERVVVDFPLFADHERRYGEIVEWHPMGKSPEYDVAVIELSEDVPPDVGLTILANVHAPLDGDSLTIFGLAAGEASGNHVRANFVGQATSAEVQIDGATAHGVFVRGGYSGAAVWDEKHSVAVGMVRAIYNNVSARVAYMTPTTSIAAAYTALPFETRHAPILLNWLWTFISIGFVMSLLYLFNVNQSPDADENPQLAAFAGMHLFVVGAALLGGIWYRHAQNLALHDWTMRIPRFANLDFSADIRARRTIALLSLLLFVLVPMYAQGHFIRRFHIQGHVYFYSREFGYDPTTLSGCLGRQGLCEHERVGRYSTIEPIPPAEGGFWNNMYQYGENRSDGRVTVTFYPIVQPVGIIALTLCVLVLQGMALRRSLR
jgi:hypothetical protein